MSKSILLRANNDATQGSRVHPQQYTEKTIKDIMAFLTLINQTNIDGPKDVILETRAFSDKCMIIIAKTNQLETPKKTLDETLTDPQVLLEACNLQDSKCFNFQFCYYPSEFQVVSQTQMYIYLNVTRVLCRTVNDSFYIKIFSDTSKKYFQREFAILKYIYWTNLEGLKQNSSESDYLNSDPKSLFVGFSGFGRDFISLKEARLFSFFEKVHLLAEKPKLWTLYEPGLCDLRTILTTIRKEKAQVSSHSAWTLLVRLTEILMNLKKLNVGHLNIRPENLFIPTNSERVRLYTKSVNACVKLLDNLKFLKLGEFGFARILLEGSLIQFDQDYVYSEYCPRESQRTQLFDAYQVDLYAVGTIMKEFILNVDEKFYGCIMESNKKQHLREKTKGLLKTLILRMTEPIGTRIKIDQLWDIVSDHTKQLLRENPHYLECVSDKEELFENKVPVAIFHAFNMSYSQIDEKMIKMIKEIGYSHIQISPTQKSHEYGAWHDKYQPQDYIVKNRYGNMEDLKSLADRAHSLGVKLIADVVFNHMGSITWWNHITRHKYENDKKMYTNYRQNLVKTYGNIFKQPNSNSNPDHYFTEWNEDGWLGGTLPQLNTMHPDVKAVQINYLKHLRSLGVDGFRFDAIKTIDKQSLRDYVSAVEDKWLYGEYVSGEVHQNHEFTPIMPITDFVFVNHLIKVFSLSGSFRDLRVPVTNHDPRSVTFAVNHDTWAAKHSRGCYGVNMVFGDDKDAELATLFILARQGGVPLIFPSESNKPCIKAGVKFRREMHNRNAPMEGFSDWVSLFDNCDLDTFLLMQRGSEGIFILNKSGNDIVRPNANISAYSLQSGYYVNAEDGSFWKIQDDGGAKYLVNSYGQFVVKKRSGIFLIRVDHR